MKTTPPDFSTPAIQVDPYPHYQRLRDDAPVCWNGRTWLISRYDDIVTLLNDPRMSSARTEQTFAVLPPDVQQELTPLRSILGSRMLLSDPPKHTRLKAIVNKAFSPRMIEGRRTSIERICHGFIDEVIDKGTMDVMADVATKLPGWAITDILGVPYEDQPRFTRWARDQVAIYDRAGLTQDRVGIMRQGQKSMLEMKAYLEVVIEQRRIDPRDDLISELVMAEEQGDRLSLDELFGMCVALLVGGNNSTSHLIGNAILTFAHQPEALAQLLADPSLIAPATEEVMRYDSPVQATSRVVKETMSFKGETFEAGQGIVVLFGSGNRDETQFANPTVFEMTRQPNRHLTFAHGPHFCLGVSIARTVSQIGILALLQRCANLKLVSERVEWLPGFAFRGPHTLPVTFEAV
ncbi:MAG: cytochrome P450 [Chloroflexi bacterium]|nr:cytochrome P450 [Chloroflexota bacterium]